MSSSPDDDTMTAALSTWNGNAALVAAVPGGLKAGRLQSPVDGTPYAQMTVSLGPSGITYMSGTGTGPRPCIDNRKLNIEIRGKKADVAAALAIARGVYEGKVLSVPNAQFMACLMLPESGTLTQDPKTKAGDDVWIGVVAVEVRTSRTTP